jgi:hypothetical protein
MTAFNAVRFRVRPGQDQKFIDAHKNISWSGLTVAPPRGARDLHVSLVRRGRWPDVLRSR